MSVETFTDPISGLQGTVINETEVPTQEILRSGWMNDLSDKALIDALVTWTTRVIGGGGAPRRGTLFDRDRFVSPDNPFQQMRTAYEAAKDDVVGGFLYASEALAFSSVRMECGDEDEEDIWAQILDDLDIEERLREMWRELNLVSQIYVAVWWGEKSYKLRGKSSATGIKRKKTFNNLKVPLGISVLDPLRIVPCLPGDSLVYTTEGPVPIRDIRVGQRVWTVKDGVLADAPVTRHIDSGVKELWEIRTRNGTLRCTANHPVMVMKREGTKGTRRPGLVETEWVRADELKAGDYVVRVLGGLEKSTEADYPSLEVAKTVGILLGDGTRHRRYLDDRLMTASDFFWRHVDKNGPNGCWLWTGKTIKDGRGQWKWHKKDYHPPRIAWQFERGTVPGTPSGWQRPVQLRRRYASCPITCVNPDHRVPQQDAPGVVLVDPDSVRTPHKRYAEFRVATNIKERDSWRALFAGLGSTVSEYAKPETDQQVILRFSSQEVARWAREVMVHKSPDRFVPHWVWTAPYKVQEAFLQGYLEADGREELPTRGAFQVRASSERLVRELQVLCVILGYTTDNIIHASSAGPRMIAGREVSFSHDTWSFRGYRETIRLAVPRNYDHYGRQRFLDGALVGRRVHSVRPLGISERVYDLTIEGTHNFIADGQVVHNCGAYLFHEPSLAYIAEPAEYDLFDSWLLGDDASGADPIIQRLIVAKFEPDYRDRKELGNLGVDPNRLYVLNPDCVFRHTVTRPSYSRWAPLKMQTVFELLDLKTQLRASDRAILMGAGNFILLVKKGDDKQPAKQMEIDMLQQRVTRLGRSAVIVGDHRLSIEIITPKTDDTINEAKWNTLDMNIQAACLPSDAPIWTPTGPLRMGEIVPGDTLWSLDSKGELCQARVADKWSTGVKPILKVRTQNQEVRCSPEHPFLVLTRSGSEVVPVWRPAAELQKGDILATVKHLPGYDIATPSPEGGLPSLGPDLIGNCVISVTPDGEEEVWDIEVTPTHNFIVDGCTVHNCWGLYHSQHAGRDDSLKLARVTARGIESQRDMLRKRLMKQIFMPTFQANDALTRTPTLAMYPHRVALDWDPSLATFYLDLLDRQIISHRTILNQVDIDILTEVERRKLEEEKYDKYLGPTAAPATPAAQPADNTAPKPGQPAPGSPNDPKRAGRAGGGNRGKGGNGGARRGAGQDPRRGVPKDEPGPDGAPKRVKRARTSMLTPGSGAPKGIRSRPKLEKHNVKAWDWDGELD